VRIFSTSIVERDFLNGICWLYTYDKKIAHDGTDDDDDDDMLDEISKKWSASK
jgi:hypothetical protein